MQLARTGFHIFGVHLDRKATMPNVERIRGEIEGHDREAVFFNMNASDPDKRLEALSTMVEKTAETEGQVRVLLHSLAFGTLKPFVAEDPKDSITQAQMDMTLDVMAHSLVYWTQGLIQHNLMRQGGRIYAMTSSGGSRVWPTYGAVSAAKASLESHMRQLALELAPRGITANTILAGVTDTPALRKIPGNEKMIEVAEERNPSGRLTRPEDVARAISALCHENTAWMTGNVIHVDGGEDIVG